MNNIVKNLDQVNNYDELMRAAGCTVPQDRGATFKEALVGSIKKAFSESGTLGLGAQFTEYNLDDAVKHLYPIQTPALNESLIGEQGGQEGEKREYRAIAKVNTNNVSGNAPAASDSVTGRGHISKMKTFPRSRPFGKLMPEFAVDRKAAQLSGKLKAYAQQLVASMATAKIIMEQNLLFSRLGAVGAMASVAGVASASGGVLASGNYTVTVTALNYWGERMFSQAAVTADIPALDAGKRPTETAGDDTGVVAVTGPTGSIAVTWDYVPSAWAYAVYVELSGVTKFAGLSYVSKFTVTDFAGLTIVADPPTVDGSDLDWQGEVVGYDGMQSQMLADPAIGTDLMAVTRRLSATTLTGSTGGSGIKEFDSLFEEGYRKYGVAYDCVFANTEDWALGISPLLTSSVAQNYRINVDAGADARIAAGVIVDQIKNQFGRKPVDVILHPLMPQGKLLFYTKDLPFENNNTGVNLTHFYNEYMRQIFFARDKDVAEPGQWGISTIGAGILTWPNACGLIDNFKNS